MQVYFLHNHYLPIGIKNNNMVRSVITPELYPDLNVQYLGEPCYFRTIDSYIEYVFKKHYFESGTIFSIENPAIFKINGLKNQLAILRSLGVKICQIYCGKDNKFYTAGNGLTTAGKQFLSELSEENFILDLSHVLNRHIKNIAENFDGKIVVSHCAASALYLDNIERSNSLNDDNIIYLAERSALFGIAFLNDIISMSNDVQSNQLLDNVIEQILYFVNLIGSENIGLGPDFIDIEYFSKRFGVPLFFPEEVYSLDGLNIFAERLRKNLSIDEVDNIFWRNVDMLLK